MQFTEVVTEDRVQSRNVQRSSNLSLGVNQPITPFGCCNFFDTCSDEGLFSLFFNGQLDLLDWMGFNVSDVCERTVEYINFVAPDPLASTGAIGDACEDPRGIDFGSCSLTINDFGRYGREGPVRDMFKPKKFCEQSPTRFLDGTLVSSESQWDELFTMNVVLADIRKAMITGNAATAGQFDGLEQIVATGYDCEALDSYVVDWNANPMEGGAGITINGNSTEPSAYDIVDFLLDLWRNIKTRISWSPLLMNQQRRVGDSILVLPGFMARCLLDFYTCWSVCSGVQFEEANKSPSLEMRDFRLQLNGGMFGHGRIFLDGDEIPLLIYDWELIKGPTRGDMYFLTGSIGSMRVWEGEHLDSRVVLETETSLGSNVGGNHFVRDDGRVLGHIKTDNDCFQLDLKMRPRIFCTAPWAQIRFQNIVCRTPSGPLSPDPTESSFYIEDPLDSASCP